MPPADRPLDAFGPRSWERPEATGQGRLAMATPLGGREVLELDGEWSFRLRGRPGDVDAEDLVGAVDGWSTVEVPGCWTMQGFDRPQYTNTQMPFPGPPGTVPAANPTGVHRRTVTVPEAWRGRRVVLHVGAAESVLYVHVDGTPVGMGKDSRLPHAFELTDHVEPGRPFELALTVVRWSDATWLEDQDHWYHAGLHRSVRLEARPATHVADVHAVADLDPATGLGHLDVRVAAATDGWGPKGWAVRATVAGARAEAPLRLPHPTNDLVNLYAFEGPGARLTFPDLVVDPWTAETPALHDLVVELLDGDGTVADAVSVAIGFRRVEVVGHELRVNGRAVLVKGVNRHDHDPVRGKAVTRASIEADVVLMKQHGLNAVRTSHYPNDDHLYDVCDRLGMYVVDEADIETHAYLRSLTKDPVWSLAIVERIARMAQRDKCHPSVIAWSLGNESGVSAAHQAAAAWLRCFDPTRPIHYESGITEDGFVGRGEVDLATIMARPRTETDLVAPMYAPVEDLVAWATRSTPERPLILCEYAHAMGNAGGGLDRYWEAFRTHPGLQGGFVWDWVDQALVQRLDDGTERLAYGGDFGDEPNDGPFCCNGLVAADRTPHPALLELAALVAPVRVSALDAARGRFSVTNEHDFLDLSWLVPTWSLSVDGEEVDGGELGPLDVAPGASVEVRVPVVLPASGAGQRAHVELAFRTAEDLPWAPAGHVVARSQHLAAAAAGPARAPGPAPTALRALEVLEPRLALWRSPIDNEVFGPRHAERWDGLGLRDGAGVTLETSMADHPDGGCVVTHVVVVPDHLDDLPRVGVRLHVGAGVHAVDWLGDGPHECYSDRRASARHGRWTTSVDDWPVPYVHPQASGNRVGVRWLRLLDADGAPLLVVDELDGLDVTVARWTDEDLDAAGHLEDLPQQDDCWLWLDARHRGVGTGAVGPDVAAEHRVGPGTYRWSYRLR